MSDDGQEVPGDGADAQDASAQTESGDAEVGRTQRFLGGNASRAELYGLAIGLFVLAVGTVGGAVVLTNSSSESGEVAIEATTTTSSSTTTTTTTAPPVEEPAPPPAGGGGQTITTDARGAQLPFPVPAGRCESVVTIPNVIGMEQWQVATRWPTGFPECGNLSHLLFGYDLEGNRIAGGSPCPDGTPARVESQSPAPGTVATIAQLVSSGTSTTWAPCPGVVKK